MLRLGSQLHNLGLLPLNYLLMMTFNRADCLLPLLKLAHQLLDLQILLTICQFISHIFHAFKVFVNLQTLGEHVPLDD
jgi:hypothetical protein